METMAPFDLLDFQHTSVAWRVRVELFTPPQ
jgi:hypothetical protein